MAFTMGGAAAARATQVAAPALSLKKSPKLSSKVTSTSNKKVAKLEQEISSWLGKESKLIQNEAGDHIFLSKDGSKCVRFDFNRPYPHNSPHAHVEIKVNGKWKKSGPIYPIDVPHN